MFGMLLIISSILLFIIICFAKPDSDNQISTSEAIIFWGSAIVFVVSLIIVVTK